MEQYLSDQNQLHIFDNDNFSIIPKSIFSDNDNLPISCKNAYISAVDNFFDNIAHPYWQDLFALLSSSQFSLRLLLLSYLFKSIRFEKDTLRENIN